MCLDILFSIARTLTGSYSIKSPNRTLSLLVLKLSPPTRLGKTSGGTSSTLTQLITAVLAAIACFLPLNQAGETIPHHVEGGTDIIPGEVYSSGTSIADKIPSYHQAVHSYVLSIKLNENFNQ